MWIGGLDLGRQADYTALTLLEGQTLDRGKNKYTLRYLKRWELGTPYVTGDPDHPGIGEDLQRLLAKDFLRDCLLAVDRTGVGVGVLDGLRAIGLPVVTIGITITSGMKASQEEDGSWNVPKRDLVGVLQLLLGQDRLKTAQVPLASVLQQELRTFQCKITAAGNDTYEAWRENAHDDCVLALALACWLAEKFCLPFGPDSIGTGGRPAILDVPQGVFQGRPDWRGWFR